MPKPTTFYVNHINKQMPLLIRCVKDIRKHLKLMRKLFEKKIGPDPRQVNQMSKQAIKEIERLKKQANDLEAMSRNIRRKDLGDQYGAFMGNLKGQLRNFDKEVKGFGADGKACQKAAMDALKNNPTRYGQAPAEFQKLFAGIVIITKICVDLSKKLAKT